MKPTCLIEKGEYNEKKLYDGTRSLQLLWSMDACVGILSYRAETLFPS
jgi:hypothetical protein